MKTIINRIRIALKWLLVSFAILATSYAFATHPTISLYIRPAVSIIAIFFFCLCFYILDSNQKRKMWNEFIEEFDANKGNLEWLLDKQKTLLNPKHTNIFRKGVHERMYKLCEIEQNKLETATIQLNEEINLKKLELEELKTLVEKLKEVKQSIEVEEEKMTRPHLSLNPDIKGAKTNLYRVINALLTLNFFCESDRPVRKDTVFKEIEIIFNIESKNYANVLSGAYKNNSEEANIDIFEQLEAVTLKLIREEKKL